MFGKGSVEQLFFTSFLTLAWFSVHIKEWPYRFPEDNWLKLASDFTIFATVIVALAHHTTDEDHKSLYNGFLMALYLGLVPACTAAACVQKWRRSRVRPTAAVGKVGAAFTKYRAGVLDATGRDVLVQYLATMRQTGMEQKRRWEVRLCES